MPAGSSLKNSPYRSETGWFWGRYAAAGNTGPGNGFWIGSESRFLVAGTGSLSAVQLTVPQLNDAIGSTGQFQIVGDQDNGQAFFAIQLPKNFSDFPTAGCVQVARGFVRQKN